MDDRYYIGSALASWCFWREDQPKVSQNRQLGPYIACNRDHTCRIKSAWIGLTAFRFRYRPQVL